MTDPMLAILVAVLIAAVFLAGIAGLVARRAAPSSQPQELQLRHIEDRLSTIEKRQDTTEHHIGNIRQMIGALPTKDVVHRMDLQLTATAGKVEQVSSEVAATGRAVERIEGYLLNKKAPTP